MMQTFVLVMVAHACNVFKASLVCIVRPLYQEDKTEHHQKQNNRTPNCVGLLL